MMMQSCLITETRAGVVMISLTTPILASMTVAKGMVTLASAAEARQRKRGLSMYGIGKHDSPRDFVIEVQVLGRRLFGRFGLSGALS